jgi:hypothetical protein
MIQQFDQHLQSLVSGEPFVKIPVGFFGFLEIAEFLCRLFHIPTIDLAANLSERI